LGYDRRRRDPDLELDDQALISREHPVPERRTEDMEKRTGNVASEEILERVHSRGDFLKVLGAAGVGAAVGSNALLREALSQERLVSNPRPTDLTFSIKKQYRLFDLLAKNFVQLRDGFDWDTSGDYAVLAPTPESNDGNASIRRGTLRINGDAYFALFRSSTSRKTPRSRR
jgi:hypothetical protein